MVETPPDYPPPVGASATRDLRGPYLLRYRELSLAPTQPPYFEPREAAWRVTEVMIKAAQRL
jgi:hypothetical protein